MIFLNSVKDIDKNKLLPTSYVREIPWVQNYKEIKFERPITFFVGENGTGKSTLLEAIAIALGFNPEGGSKNFSFSTYDSHSDLSRAITLSKGIHFPKDGFFLRSESFYNVATEIENLSDGDDSFFYEYGGKSMHSLSHGEGFKNLMMNRFRGNGIYLLDEPEAALSIQSQMSMLCILRELERKNSQFIIVTHSPVLIAYPNSTIYEFTNTGIEKKDYEDTEVCIITRAFLNNPQRMIKTLFEE